MENPIRGEGVDVGQTFLHYALDSEDEEGIEEALELFN